MSALEVSSRIGSLRLYWNVTVSVLLVMFFFIAGMIFLVAPFQALDWFSIPFPGFVIEQTLLIGSHEGPTWNARSRISVLEQLFTLNGEELEKLSDYSRILKSLSPGDEIAIQLLAEDGAQSLYQRIPLIQFPIEDRLRLFWLPYGIGIIYFFLGVGVFIRRGHTPSGQAFAFFSICIALSTVLLFDLIATHYWVGFWSTAVSHLGSAAVLLGFAFPDPLPSLRRRPWLVGIPVSISLILSVWCLRVNYDLSQPWAYVYAWRASFLYAVLGVLFFFVVLSYRLVKSPQSEEAQPVRVTLWGGFFAFTPALIWLASPFLGIQMIWDPILFLPLLMLFPVAVGAAIVRYRLWDIEVIINRTIVYSALTLVLSGVFFIGILSGQLLLMGLLRRATIVSVTVSSVVTTLLFNPLRVRIQNFVDQRFFRHKYDVTKAVVAYQASVLDTIEYEAISKGLISIINETMRPTHVALYTCNSGNSPSSFLIKEDDPLRSILMTFQDVVEVSKLSLNSDTLKQFKEKKFALVVPLVNQGELIGVINLGAKRSDQPYTADDRYLLKILAAQVAPALRIANLVQRYEEKVVEQERTRQEMEVARLVQQALLPRHIPDVPGWKIAFHYQPARAVGGDFYDFFVRGDELVVVIGDVTDKGVPAALVMATTRSILRGTARNGDRPGAALKKANDILVPEMFKSMFVTCFYIVINYRTGSAIYANAGHNLPKQRTKHGVVELFATGMPLGLMENMVYEEYETEIHPEDSILFYSDGLVEAHNRRFEMFGDREVDALVALDVGPPHLVNMLMTAVQGFSGRYEDPEDDITLVCIQRAKNDAELL